MGESLDPEVKRGLVELLREYNDIFAWSHEDMPGIPLSLATHRLAVDATFKPIKQKKKGTSMLNVMPRSKKRLTNS